MKKTFKQILSVLLAAVLLFGAAPASGIAAVADWLAVIAAAETYSGDCGANGDNVKWTLNTATGVLTISGTGAMQDYDYSDAQPWRSNRDSIKSISIKSGVTSIGQAAFAYCSGLTSVTIGNSVTSIGNYTFYGCSGLTSVTIGNSVTSIGMDAFRDCYGLKRVDYTGTLAQWCGIQFGDFVSNPVYHAQQLYISGQLLTKASIPNGVKRIGNYAFLYCVCLTSVTIPNSVTSIGDEAFYHCTSLTSVTIGNSVTSIGDSAFVSCTSLTSVTIPNSVTSIGDWAFYDCSSLTSVTIGNSVTSIGKYAFSGCESITSVTIPNSVTSIGDSAFSDCESITSVTIGNSVTSIGDWAFSSCSSLTSVTIGNSVKSIGDDAFSGCESLTSVTIGSSVTSIGDEAFNHCSSLTSVTIPNSVTSIGDWAFCDCSSLTSVTIGSSVTSIGKDAFNHCSSLTSVTIPNSVTSIGDWAFYDCSSLTSVTIGNSVTSIGKYAFCHCTSITSVTIPNSVTSIGEYAFGWCTSLTSVTIPNSVTSIGDNAFHGCESIASVTIPNSVTTIGADAFDYCYSLTRIDYTGTLAQWCGIQFNNSRSNPVCYARQLYISGQLLTNAAIPNGVKRIGDYAFCDYESLTSVTIPNSVTSIGDGAFDGCSGLMTVTIPNSVKSIGEYAFQDVFNIVYNGSASGSPWGAKYMNLYSEGGFCFDSAKKQKLLRCSPSIQGSVTIPNSVTSIGDSAFSDCSGLTSVTIPNSVTSIGGGAFSGCSGLTRVTIPNSVTSIGEGAFGYCTSLTSITIPNSVTSIGGGAFSGCTSLTSVAIPSSVTSIGSEAFLTHLDPETIADLQDAYDAAVAAGDDYVDWLIPLSAAKMILEHPNGCLTDVYYQGSQAQWNAITIEEGNEDLQKATIHYNSSGNESDPEHPLLKDEIVVMSYNVYVENDDVKGKTNGKTYDCRYETRARYIVNNIMEVVPDSVGFQEVTYGMKLFLENFEDLHGRIMASVYSFVGEYRGGKGNNEACFIAYRKDKYDLKDSGTRWLSDTGKKYSKYPTAGYNRVFTYALLENKTTKQQYLHINTHIDHDDEAAEYAAGQIIYFVNHSYPNTPVVLTGDFNHTKSSQMYKNLISAGFADANVGNNTTHTYTNCFNQGEKEDGVMKVYDPKTIDFILVRNGLENGIRYYNVCAEDYSDAAKYGKFALPYPYASDHHPIVSYLSLKYRETAITADTVYTTEKGHTSTNSVKYDSKWFGCDNKQYNHELAQFCADFAMLGYTASKTELEQNLGKFGFANAEIDLKTGQELEGRDRVNYFIADKKEIINGEEYTVVFAGFIGSNGYQWFSNFDPYGTERQQSYAGNSEKDKVHLGFADARDFAIDILQKHINGLGVDRSKIKLVLTGHSRGAAAANLIAAKILDGKAPLVYGANLYAYTYATPNVVNQKDSSVNVNAEKYKCIFNVVNPEDFVTKVLLHDWGYARYGVTYTLPSQTNDSNYYKYLSKMKGLFGKYYGGIYDPYKLGEERTYGVISDMSKNVGSINELYTKPFWYDLDGLIPRYKDPFTFFKNTLLKYLVKDDMEGVKKVALEGGPFYLGIIAYFAWPDIQIDSLHSTAIGYLIDAIADAAPGGKFRQAHQVETYCAYMNALTASQLTEYRAAYKESFNCPVDVEVYDTDTNELVGRIENNTVDETVAAKENAVVADVDGDSKEFWLPSNGNYRVVITGNDNGTMDCSVAQIDPDIGEVMRESFFDVAVQDGVSMTGDFSETFTGLDELVLTMADGTALAPTERVEEENKRYQINVTIEGSGYASESRTAVSGDYVTLSAATQEGADFLGWYENGALVSNETELSFVAKSNRNLIAKFNAKTYTVTATASAGGTVTGGGAFDHGASATVTATPDSGYTFAGWYDDTAKVSDSLRYTFTVTKDVTLTAKFAKAAQPNPTVKIQNYTANKTIDYRASITFTANVTNPVTGATVHWFVDGQDKGTGETYTAKEAKQDFTVQARYMKDGDILAESETETVKVKSGFIDKVIAFFRGLFGRLPKVVQEYLGIERIDLA